MLSTATEWFCTDEEAWAPAKAGNKLTDFIVNVTGQTSCKETDVCDGIRECVCMKWVSQKVIAFKTSFTAII